MEAYKITTAASFNENLSWDRVCDVLRNSADGNIWIAHRMLEDAGIYKFLGVYGDLMILERM